MVQPSVSAIALPPAPEWLSTFVLFVRMNPWLAADDPVIEQAFNAYLVHCSGEAQTPPRVEPEVVTPATAPELARHRTPAPKAPPTRANGHVRRDGGYTCPVCSATYAKAGNLERHLNQVHGADKVIEATPAVPAAATSPKVDTTAAVARGRSTSAGVASMCLSGSHAICAAAKCTCHCHGGEGRSEVA